MREVRNAYRISMGKSLRKQSLGRSRRLEDNIKMDFKECL
jgi:hypothetical protein